jgi:Transmembrane amino acid transporter protein
VVKVLWQMATVGIADMFAPVALFHFDLAAVGAIPVMVFAYHCHVQSVPIYYELTFDPVLVDRKKMRSAALQRAQQQQQQHQQIAAEAATPVESPAVRDVATEHVPLLQRTNGSSMAATAANGSTRADTVLEVVPVHRTSAEVRRKLFGMARVLLAAYAECTVLYLSTGIAGYILFPIDAQSNILKNFPANDVLMQVMCFLSLSLFLSSLGEPSEKTRRETLEHQSIIVRMEQQALLRKYFPAL